MRSYDRACVTVGDVIWLFGGQEGGSTPIGTDRVDVYNPLADLWSADTRLPIARYRLSAARIANEVFILGGRTRLGSSANGYAGRVDVVEILNLDVIADDAAP